MYKIVIIGEIEDILPYQSIGFEIQPVKTMSETIIALKNTTLTDSVGLILITENMAEQCLDTIVELRNKIQKAITIIPTQQGCNQTSTKELGKEISRAVGVEIPARFH